MIREISITVFKKYCSPKKYTYKKEINLPFIQRNRVNQCWLYEGIAVYVRVLVHYALFCDFQSSVPILDIS